MRHYLFLLCLLVTANTAQAKETLLNVSYDPTRELYAEYNRHFVKQAGRDLRIRMSHGGSGKQARSVMEGLQADVITLALGADIDAIAGKGLLAKGWEKQLPDHASPYRSIIVFLVRKGNPKDIRGWDDLAKEDIKILTPNPKTSGGARWNYLAAWTYAQETYKPATAKHFMKSWLKNVLIFDTGARAATTNFVRRKQGDVLITWENEAHVAQKYFGADAFEIVVPQINMLAEPSVAVVDSVVDVRGTRALAAAYLEGLYSDEGQRIIAGHFFRPLDDATRNNVLPPLGSMKVKTIRDLGGWQKVQKEHFAEDALFDQLTGRE